MSVRPSKLSSSIVRSRLPSFETLDQRLLLSTNETQVDVGSFGENADSAENESIVSSYQVVRNGAVSDFPVIMLQAPDGPPYQLLPPSNEPDPTTAIQLESIADRTIMSDGFEEFKAGTAVTSVSPALSSATSNDVVVHEDGLLGDQLTAVVLKPHTGDLTYQVPKPADGENTYRFLEDHLEAAIDAGANVIEFPKDHTFEIIPPQPTGSHLNLEGLDDVTIDLNGSTIQLTQISLGVKIEESERLLLKNGTIKGVGQLATVARVVADDNDTFRFEVLPEYRSVLEAGSNGLPNLVTVGLAENDPDGGYRIKTDGYAELFINRGNDTNNFVYSDGSFISTSPLISKEGFAPGQLVWLLHQNNTGHGMLLDNEAANTDISLQDISFVNIPGMAIAGEVVRGLHLNNVNILKDENDPLAFFASSSDGVHINANGGDIIIENSTFGPNGDDKINIKGNYWKVTALDRTNNTMTVQPVDRNTSVNRWGWADQRVVFIDSDFSVLGETELAEDSFRDNGKRHDITLKKIPANVQLGSLIGNVDNSGARVVIRNNTFDETRAQGVLVQSSHVVLDNNSFVGIAGPAIKVNQALGFWYEAINTRNVLIQDNTFSRSSRSLAKSNELIHLNQYDGLGQDVEVIDQVRIVGNQLLGVDAPINSAPPTVPNTPSIDEPTNDESTAEQPTSDPVQPPIDPDPIDPETTDPTVPLDPFVELIFLNKALNPSASQIEGQIELYNRTTEAQNFRDMEFRYFINPDGLTPFASILSGNAQSSQFTSQYVEEGSYVSFKLVDDFLVAANDRLKFRFLVENEEGALFDQSNDSSFLSSHATRQPTSAIGVFKDGLQIWGDVP